MGKVKRPSDYAEKRQPKKTGGDIINQVKIINQEQADELCRRLPKPDNLILLIGLETGLRISDILRLRNRDIINPMTVYIGRLQTVCSYQLSAWLFNELISRGGHDNPEEYIFSSQRKWKRSMHRTTYHRHIKKALEGLNFDCSAHSSRKFFLMAY